MLSRASAVTVSKFFKNFYLRALHLHFALGTANVVVVLKWVLNLVGIIGIDEYMESFGYSTWQRVSIQKISDLISNLLI